MTYTFRMWRVLRLAVVCLLAFALPLQGVTAATMMVCGMAQQGSHSMETEHAHHAAAPAAESHPHIAAAESHDRAAHTHTSGGSSDEKSSATQEAQKCSVCASCCVGAAAPAEPLSFASVKLADQFAPLVPRSVTAYVSEGLERPPRLFLA